MTNEQIMKALEYCSDLGLDCHDCPYSSEAYCVEADALDLIKRQQAEIERLQKSLDNMTDALVKTDEYCRKAEQEAYKEFAEKFKQEAIVEHTSRSGNCWYEVDDRFIDNLVKSMEDYV